MRRIRALLLAGILLAAVIDVLAQSQAGPPPNLRIRGAVTAFDGKVLSVTTRDGEALKLALSPDAKINVLSPLKMSDIRQGSFVGVTAILRGGALQALEVHVFPESMRGTGEGHYDWDLEPGSTMTNANVDAIVTTNNGEELTLSYKGGSQDIIVPRSTPIITFMPAPASTLKPHAQVFIIASRTADGHLTALRILIGQGRIKPPM